MADGAPTPKPIPWPAIWSAAGGIAGAAGLVYLIGAAIEAVRLNHAGLPVDHAIGVIPRSTLFALAANALFIPAIVTGAALFLFVTGLQRAGDKLLHPEAVEKRAAARTRRTERRVERRQNPSLVSRAMRRIWSFGPVAATRLRLSRAWSWAWATRAGRVLIWLLLRPLVILAILYVFVLPWTVGALIVSAGVFIQLSGQTRITHKRTNLEITRRTEALLIGGLVALALSGETLAQQITRPEPLALASVTLVGHPRLLTGEFVANTPEGLYVGAHHSLLLIPERLIDQVAISNARPRKPETARTLLDRIQ